MSFENLRNALVKMPATGPSGFEGLAATLLSAVTGDEFYIARSGDQPADAISAAGHIAIQGKRYDKTPLDETEFEGDFSKACRLCPRLDCYVLAASRTTAQLSSLAQDLESGTGVDVILLQFDAPESELPALCVSFWDRIKDFAKLSELGSDFAAWAAAESKQREIVAAVKRLRAVLMESVPLAATVERKLRSYLNGRFGIDASSSRPSRFRIQLPAAVLRRAPQQQLDEWWRQRKTRAAVAEGEEGMGKSWTASGFCQSLIQQSAALVVWLDSADWAGLTNVEAALDAGLMQAGFGDPKLRERLVRKAMTRWSDRLLVVLDGVNERTARDTAQRLLAQLHASEIAPCRLLFTTRPVVWKSDERSLWKLVTPVPINKFTEEELKEALGSLPNPIQRTELPGGLVEVARVPRYFQRAVELRARFKSLANVTKEMVLWADLLDKVASGDPQITAHIGWNSAADVKRALLKLANAARAIQTQVQTSTDSYSLLQNCFGDKFEQIRLDLSEQRVVLEPTGENPAPSPAHVVLGFAIHLGALAAKHSADSLSDLADRLRKELEPVLAQDQLTEALFVSLQLSALQHSDGHNLSSRARSAFLLAWVSSQNSCVEPLRLAFWASRDQIAYLDFVEEIFIEPVSDGWAGQITRPLNEIWSAAELKTVVLDERLRRWLKLIWKSHDLPASFEMVVDDHHLPIARSRSQLNLSFVALAVLSDRPDESFLGDLALAWATDSLSTQRHIWPKHPNGDAREVHDLGCKDLTWNLGPLLRWRYTEAIQSKIELLRKTNASDKVIVKGLQYMSRAFDEFGWIRGSIPEARLRKGLPYFPERREECKNRMMDCPELAMRDDFPDISLNDRDVVREKVEAVFASQNLHSSRSRTHEDLELEHHLSWFAKYYPTKFAQLGSDFRLSCLDGGDVAIALHYANPLPFLGSPEFSRELLEKAESCAERELADSTEHFCWSLLQLHVLAITCFDENELKEWLIFASERKQLRREIHFYPIPILYPLLLPDGLAKFSREQAKRLCNEPPSASTPDANESIFDFWAYVGGLGGEPDADFNTWVRDQIKLRKPTGNRQYYWLLLWFRSAPQAVLEDAVASGSILEFLLDDGLWPLLSSKRWIHDWSKVPHDFSKIADALPIDDVGTLLLNANRKADLERWGKLVFNKALELVGKPPFERSFWGATNHTIGSSGEISGSDCDREEGSVNPLTEGLRPKPQSGFSVFHNQAPLEELDRKANEGIRIWREDRDRLKKLKLDAFERFGARRALLTWCDEHPVSFKEYASALLEQAVTKPNEAFHLGAFITYVIDALVSLEPDSAVKMDAAIRNSSFRVNVTNEYGVSTFTAAFWHAAASGNTRCQEICARLLEECSTDEELMFHAVTAQAEGAREVLVSMCDNLLAEPLAKSRSLAVSLLAWIPVESEIDKLQRLVAHDPSGWIRRHAEWAVECAKQEASARRHYERTLTEVKRNVVAARLHVLIPALTPAARWWHRDLELKSKVFETSPRNVQAELAFFWYEMRSNCKKTPKLFGRSLSEYLRGERIHDLRNPKPRLLDEVNDDR